jgi:hypothetical protein
MIRKLLFEFIPRVSDSGQLHIRSRFRLHQDASRVYRIIRSRHGMHNRTSPRDQGWSLAHRESAAAASASSPTRSFWLRAPPMLRYCVPNAVDARDHLGICPRSSGEAKSKKAAAKGFVRTRLWAISRAACKSAEPTKFGGCRPPGRPFLYREVRAEFGFLATLVWSADEMLTAPMIDVAFASDLELPPVRSCRAAVPVADR